MNRGVVVWILEHTRHLCAGVAFGAGESHRQGALDRIGRQTNIFVTGRELFIKINAKLVASFGCDVEVGGASTQRENEEQDARKFHFVGATITILRRYSKWIRQLVRQGR